MTTRVLVDRDSAIEAAQEHECRGYHENCDCRGDIAAAIMALPPAATVLVDREAVLAVIESYIADADATVNELRFAIRSLPPAATAPVVDDIKLVASSVAAREEYLSRPHSDIALAAKRLLAAVEGK